MAALCEGGHDKAPRRRLKPRGAKNARPKEATRPACRRQSSTDEDPAGGWRYPPISGQLLPNTSSGSSPSAILCSWSSVAFVKS